MEKDLNKAILNFIAEHPDWAIILRDGHNTTVRGGTYFCHLMSPEWLDGYGSNGGISAKGWADTPLEAFNYALGGL